MPSCKQRFRLLYVYVYIVYRIMLCDARCATYIHANVVKLMYTTFHQECAPRRVRLENLCAVFEIIKIRTLREHCYVDVVGGGLPLTYHISDGRDNGLVYKTHYCYFANCPIPRKSVWSLQFTCTAQKRKKRRKCNSISYTLRNERMRRMYSNVHAMRMCKALQLRKSNVRNCTRIILEHI